jgi:hypothetical protein
MLAASSCANCHTTPSVVTATFADVVNTACEVGIADYVSGTDVAANINGAHELVVTGECTWGLTYAGALGDYGKIDNFGADAGCTPPAGSTDEYDTLVLTFQVSGDTSFTITAITQGDDNGYCFRYRGWIVGADCNLSGPYSNIITTGSYLGTYSPANSGNVTLAMAY